MSNVNEVTPSNVIVVLDRFTKDTVEAITYDALSKHVSVLTDIKELADVHFEADVVIFEPAVTMIVTPEILEELITTLKIRVHLIYQNDSLITPIVKYCHCVKADYSTIDWNLVYAAVKEDLAILEPYQRSVKVLDSSAGVVPHIPADLKEYFERFRATYINLACAAEKLIEQNAALAETVETQEKLGKEAIAAVSELKTLLDASQDKCHSYEAMLSKTYDITKGGFFPDRPRVLYIKSISHLAGIDTFISVLFAALQKQYKASVKVVKLVDASSTTQLRYVPSFYVPVKDSYNTSVLLENDFLLKLGAYSMMFDTLLLNRSGLEYLIVHDMRSTLNSALDATLVDLRVNEMTQDYAALGEYDNVLSNTGAKVMFPWDYNDIKKHTGTKSVRLVNHPTIVEVLEHIM